MLFYKASTAFGAGPVEHTVQARARRSTRQVYITPAGALRPSRSEAAVETGRTATVPLTDDGEEARRHPPTTPYWCTLNTLSGHEVAHIGGRAAPTVRPRRCRVGQYPTRLPRCDLPLLRAKTKNSSLSLLFVSSVLVHGSVPRGNVTNFKNTCMVSILSILRYSVYLVI